MKPFLLTALLGAVFLSLCLDNPGNWLFNLTGEETPGAQIRGLVQWAMGWTHPQPKTIPNEPVAYTDLIPFGVNTFLEQEVEPEKRERSLQMIQSAGFHWIRQSFPWYDIEIHRKGDFEDRRHEPYRSAWEKYDHIVSLTEQYGLEIIARLEAPPAWSRHDGTARGAFGPPDDYRDFADYAAAVVDRYRGRIRFYQVWNEPNIYPEWGNQPVDPEAYAELLCLTYKRIKQVDPDAVVISGAMAQTIELGTWNNDYQGNNLMDTVFLQRMYAAGAAHCFDIMAVNDYMLWSGPTDHRSTLRDINFSRPMWIRDVMVANGDAQKPIWITEMNSNAAPEHIPPRFGRVTLEQQARWAPLAFERIQREWPWVGVTTVWFFKRASDAEVNQPFYYFRLVEPDFTPMPVYTALTDYLHALTPTLYPGYHQETSWQLSYRGPWEDIPDPDTPLRGYRRATSMDATLEFDWEGRRLILIPGPRPGVIRVTDEGGHTQEFALEGKPVSLHHSLWPEHHRFSLTIDQGEISVDALEIR